MARETPAVYAVDVGARGRIVLPAEVRDQLELKEKDRLILNIEEDGSIRLRSRANAIDALRGILRPLTGGRSVVDALIAGRRREVRHEAAEVRKAKGRARRR